MDQHRRRLRGLPRTGVEPRRVGEAGRRLAAVRRRQGAGGAVRRAARRRLGDRRGHRRWSRWRRTANSRATCAPARSGGSPAMRARKRADPAACPRTRHPPAVEGTRAAPPARRLSLALPQQWPQQWPREWPRKLPQGAVAVAPSDDAAARALPQHGAARVHAAVVDVAAAEPNAVRAGTTNRRPPRRIIHGGQRTAMLHRSLAVVLLALLFAVTARAQTADALPFWNDGPAKARIVAFVQAVTQPSSRDFVAHADRVAVFDNDYLRVNGFKTWIVSGGGVEFLRTVSEELYGVPPEQVVGSSIKTKYEVRNGRPAIVRLPEIDFIDDKAGKRVGIHKDADAGHGCAGRAPRGAAPCPCSGPSRGPGRSAPPRPAPSARAASRCRASAPARRCACLCRSGGRRPRRRAARIGSAATFCSGGTANGASTRKPGVCRMSLRSLE